MTAIIAAHARTVRTGSFDSFFLFVAQDGTVAGRFSVTAIPRDWAMCMARFANPRSYFAAEYVCRGRTTGFACHGHPGENGIGTVSGERWSLSNTTSVTILVNSFLARTSNRGTAG